MLPQEVFKVNIPEINYVDITDSRRDRKYGQMNFHRRNRKKTVYFTSQRANHNELLCWPSFNFFKLFPANVN